MQARVAGKTELSYQPDSPDLITQSLLQPFIISGVVVYSANSI